MTTLYAKQLLALLGSFWTRIFTSADLLKQLFRGQLSTHSQSEQGVAELVQSAGNAEVPAGRTSTWTKMVFSIYSQSPIEYGNPSRTYGSLSTYYYGQLYDNKATYSIDDDILSIPFMYDSLVNPTQVLTEGIDYKISSGKLVFKKPLTFEDKSVTLYARNTVRESGFTTSRLGYALGTYLGDEVYRKVPFKHVWRMSSYGPNYLDFLSMLGSCSGTPVTAQDEVVEMTEIAGSICVVVTDKAAYAVPASKALSLSIGQALPQGSPMSTGIQLLHDKQLYVGDAIPSVYRDKRIFKYGSKLALASSMVILKADIAGPESAALKTLKNTLPVDVKVLVFTNINLTGISMSGANFSATCTKSLTPSTPALGINENQISLKAKSKVKYTLYGY